VDDWVEVGKKIGCGSEKKSRCFEIDGNLPENLTVFCDSFVSARAFAYSILSKITIFGFDVRVTEVPH
jgi:hypothetical protein